MDKIPSSLDDYGTMITTVNGSNYIFYDPTDITVPDLPTEPETVRSPSPNTEIDQLRAEVKELREKVQWLESIIGQEVAVHPKKKGYWAEP